MRDFNRGCKIVRESIKFNHKIDVKYLLVNDEVRIYHDYHNFLNLCGKCGKKAKEFNDLEKRKIELTRKQLDIMVSMKKDKEELYDEYKEQFRNMTDEQIEHHIGLEKIRNVIEGFDKEHGIDRIRHLVNEIKKEKD